MISPELFIWPEFPQSIGYNFLEKHWQPLPRIRPVQCANHKLSFMKASFDLDFFIETTLNWDHYLTNSLAEELTKGLQKSLLWNLSLFYTLSYWIYTQSWSWLTELSLKQLFDTFFVGPIDDWQIASTSSLNWNTFFKKLIRFLIKSLTIWQSISKIAFL